MQQNDENDDMSDDQPNFGDINKMFGFIIEKTATNVLKKANAQHLEQTKELIASLQLQEADSKEEKFSEEELILIGEAVVDFIKIGKRPDINKILIELIPTLVTEKKAEKTRVEMTTLAYKFGELEATRLKELNNDNVLRSLTAFDGSQDKDKDDDKDDDTEPDGQLDESESE